jgi:hypothetical protein
MVAQDPEPSWLGYFSSYALSAEYPAVLRYISGAFVRETKQTCRLFTNSRQAILGLMLILPFVFLILLDLLIWAVRACWTRGSPQALEAAAQARPASDGIRTSAESDTRDEDALPSGMQQRAEGGAYRRAHAGNRGDG